MEKKRYCTTLLENGVKVYYDKFAQKTFFVEGNFQDVKEDYERCITKPLKISPKYTTFVLNVTNECNLRCKYCSRYHEHYSAQFMDSSTMYNIISSVLNYAKRIEERCVIQFHGGEPTLRIKNIKGVIEKFDKKDLMDHVDFRIQTNGTNITDEFINFCKEFNIQVGVSIDGPKEITDELRQNGYGTGVTDKVLKNVQKVKKELKDCSLSCLCVVTQKSIDKSREIFDFFVNNGIEDVSFLPLYNDYSCICDDKTIIPRNDELLYFSKQIIDKWISYLKTGKVLCIPNYQIWFWNFISNNADKFYDCHSCCGMGETILFIEKSGEIYPCGPFSYDKHMALGKIVNSEFEFEKLTSTDLGKKISMRLPKKCSECALQGLCKSGCAANAYLKNKDFLSEDPYCEYWQGIITYILRIISEDPKVLELIPNYTIRL